MVIQHAASCQVTDTGFRLYSHAVSTAGNGKRKTQTCPKKGFKP
jgi:hypothetical protein